MLCQAYLKALFLVAIVLPMIVMALPFKQGEEDMSAMEKRDPAGEHELYCSRNRNDTQNCVSPFQC
jgi:hypothetical protein